MRIGVVIAIDTEYQAFLEALGSPSMTYHEGPFSVMYRGIQKAGRIRQLYVVKSGAGQIAAAAATQMLIDKYAIDVILNFGICGGLTDEMSLYKTAVVGSVVHYDFDTSSVDGCEKARHLEYQDVYIPAKLPYWAEKSLPTVVCASGDRFVADPQLRRELHEQYGAEICDMEAAGILLTANAHHVDTLMVKTVSDSLSGGADEYQKMAKKAAERCVEFIGRVGVI